MRETKERVDTAYREMKEHVHFGLASEWKGIEHGRNVNWIPLGILGLIVVIWATKFLSAIRLKQKLKKAWDGAPFLSQERYRRKFDRQSGLSG